jgi:hypothetical protein
LSKSPSPGALARVGGLGPTAQAIVPGLYAWTVTVAPPAFARGALGVCKGAAILGVALLLLAPALESKRPASGRIVSIWGLVGTSLLVWVLAPAAWMTPPHPDPVRNIAGMFGWALFAVASIAPALTRGARDGDAKNGPAQPSRPLARRGDSGHIDAAILILGIGLAALLQLVGWQAAEPERAILTRLVGLSAGVMIVSASGAIVVFRHTTHWTLRPTQRAKRAVVPLVLFGLWIAAGTVYALAGGAPTKGRTVHGDAVLKD